ncbi:MAG: hypothetical protein AB7I33_00020 [Gemmatimonadales bacterium]
MSASPAVGRFSRATAEYGLPGGSSDPRIVALLQLSIALHKHAVYPPSHPALATADEAVIRALQPVLADGGSLSIGVGRNGLTLDNSLLENGDAFLSDLAGKLHRRHIGGLVLQAGLTVSELTDALNAISQEPRRFRELIQTAHGLQMPVWAHIRLSAHAFERLELADGDPSLDDGEPAEADRVWQLLALTVFAQELGEEETSSPARLASAIARRAAGTGGGARLGDLLLRLASEAREANDSVRGQLDTRVRDLMNSIPREALISIFGGDPVHGGRQRLLEAVDTLPVDTVVDLVKSSAAGTDQDISRHLMRLLRKLSQGAGRGGDAENDVREVVRELLQNWNAGVPNPAHHTRVLEHLTSRLADAEAGPARTGQEALRLLQIALETDAAGNAVIEAVDMLLEDRELEQLFFLLDEAPDGSRVVERVMEHITADETCRRILLSEPVDQVGCRRLLERIGSESVGMLLDVLALSETSGTRQLVLERLTGLGTSVAAALVERLPNVPWHIQRNLLALLARGDMIPEGFSAAPWAEHQESTVRLQALSVMLRVPEERDDAVLLALADSDSRVVQLGLEAAQKGLPRGALPRLMPILRNPSQPAILRTRGMLLLEQYHLPYVRDWLIERLTYRTRILRRLRLVSKAPEVIAALQVLNRAWNDDPRAQQVLRLARTSGDIELATAAGPEIIG